MSGDIEDLLRRSLQHHSADLRPDPDTWSVVQRRIRRAQRRQWALAGAAATLVVAVTAVVLPSMLTGDDVQLQPAEPAPGGAPVATPAPPLGGFVLAGPVQPGKGPGEAISLASADGRPVEMLAEPGAPVQDLVVRPGSTTAAFTVVWRAGGDCQATLGYAVVEGRTITGSGLVESVCPGAPVFSPDGRHLAFPEADPADPSAVSLRAIGWADDGPRTGDAAGFALDGGEVELLAGEDWRWDAEATATRGALFLTGMVDGELRGFSLDLERQADGALALDPGARLESEPWLARATVGTGVRYEILATDTGAELVRRPAGPAQPVDIPEGWRDEETQRPWLAAAGDVAVVGGSGRAWVATWADDGWGPLEALPGTLRRAVPLLGDLVEPAAVPEEPAPDEEPPATAPATEELPPTESPVAEEPADSEQEGLPPAVEQTRAALAAAAGAQDWGALEGLVPSEGFSYTFDDDQDPALAIPYLFELADQGEPVLEILGGLLEQTYAEVELDDGRTMYSWPRAFVDGMESLSSAELEALEPLLGQGELDAAFERGYLWWRVGIDSDGVWRYFIAGD